MRNAAHTGRPSHPGSSLFRKTTMTRISPIDPSSAPPAAKTLRDAVQKKLGATPNMMRVMATNPSVLGAYLGVAGALSGGLFGAKLHEQIALAVAPAKGCES